jgi:hypothetical protein
LLEGLPHAALVEALNTFLKPMVVAESEIVCAAGEELDDVWLLEAGALECVTVAGEVCATLTHRGTWFGELTALGLAKTRKVTVRAKVLTYTHAHTRAHT